MDFDEEIEVALVWIRQSDCDTARRVENAVCQLVNDLAAVRGDRDSLRREVERLRGAPPSCIECSARATCAGGCGALRCNDHRSQPHAGTNLKTRAPTREEIRAWVARGGAWRVSGWYGRHDHREILTTASEAESVAIPRWAAPDDLNLALRWELMLDGAVYDWPVEPRTVCEACKGDEVSGCICGMTPPATPPTPAA